MLARGEQPATWRLRWALPIKAIWEVVPAGISAIASPLPETLHKSSRRHQ
jgi:hypothetical protein